MRPFRVLLILSFVALWNLGLEPSRSQRLALADSPKASGTMSARRVPDDALAAAVVLPAQWFENPMLEMFPIEVFQVQMMEQFGVDPKDIAGVRAVISAFPLERCSHISACWRSSPETWNFQALRSFQRPSRNLGSRWKNGPRDRRPTGNRLGADQSHDDLLRYGRHHGNDVESEPGHR